MKKIIEFKKEIVKSNREIKKLICEGVTWYKVVFVNTVRYTFKLFGSTLWDSTKIEKKVSNINFSSGMLNLAREYAENVEKCDVLIDDFGVEIFPPNYHKTKKFGAFVITDTTIEQYRNNYVWFVYNGIIADDKIICKVYQFFYT